MRKFRQNKLWRDKAVDIMVNEHGSRIHWQRLNDTEFNEQIKLKLLEEAQEVATAKNHDALVSELADLYEVIDALMQVNGIAENDIVTIQKQKQELRGGFEGRRFVEIAEHPVGGFGEKYCLADPEKYPEIVRAT